MAVKLRLQRHGRSKAPFYHIVAADARAPRDGRFIEKIGTYNPLTVPATIELDGEAALRWMHNGAQPTDTVAAIFRFKGVMYHKHLMRGVKKGAMTVEQAEEKLAAWKADKENKVEGKKVETEQKKVEFHKVVFGKPKPKPVVVVEEPITEPQAGVDEEIVAFEAEQAAAADTTEA